MQQNLEQRYTLKFCASFGFNPTKSFDMLKTAHGESVMSRASVFRWHNAFTSGRDKVQDQERGGRPTSKYTKNHSTEWIGEHEKVESLYARLNE